jgi:ribosomal-protein-alanine N-acetyltransferase
VTVLKQLSKIHARAFTNSRPWSAAKFQSLLSNPHCFLCIVLQDAGQSSMQASVQAFAMGRVVADEAELLTLATDPNQRRNGHARKCLDQFEEEAKKRGATGVSETLCMEFSPCGFRPTS